MAFATNHVLFNIRCTPQYTTCMWFDSGKLGSKNLQNTRLKIIWLTHHSFITRCVLYPLGCDKGDILRRCNWFPNNFTLVWSEIDCLCHNIRVANVWFSLVIASDIYSWLQKWPLFPLSMCLLHQQTFAFSIDVQTSIQTAFTVPFQPTQYGPVTVTCLMDSAFW